MLKRYHQFVSAVFAVVDVTITVLCFIIAYYLRFYTNLFEFIQTPVETPEQNYLTLINFVLIASIWFFVFKFSGLYHPRRGQSLFEEVFAVLNAVTLATFVLVALMFFQRDIEYSRLVIGIFWLFDFLCISASRTLIRLLLRELRKRNFNLRHVVIVGSGKSAGSIIKSLKDHSYYGLNVKGIVDDDEAIQGKNIYGVPVMGKTDQLIDIIKSHGIDQVFIALPNTQLQNISRLINMLKTEIVDIKLVPDVLELILLRSSVESLDGLPIIDISHTPLTGWNSILKRFFDIIFSLSALIILSPLIIIIALLIKLTSRGSVLFKQMRMGIDGKSFTMYKFRTMKNERTNGNTNYGWTTKNDPRRTKLGIYLRKSGLDEVPQLFNVLLGDMSIVGPRPEMTNYAEKFKGQISEYMLRHKVKSGITGWAQVNGWRGDTSISKRIEYDIYYIENWSFKFDLYIILKTLLTGSFHKNAY